MLYREDDPFKDNFQKFRQNPVEEMIEEITISDRYGLFTILALFWFLFSLFSSFVASLDSGRALKRNLASYHQGEEMALYLLMKLLESLRISMRS